jgi:hypothetical protein
MADARDDELRARYRALATEEPSAALDDAIRAAARRAVASAPGGARRSSTQRWAVPVSLAAVLFLSFGVVMHMQQETPSVESELRGAPPAAAPSVAPPPAAKPETRMAEPQPAQAPPPKVTDSIARNMPSEVAIAPAPRKEKKVAEPAPAAPQAPPPSLAPAASPVPAAPPASATLAAPTVQTTPLMKQQEAAREAPVPQDAAKRDAPPPRAAASPAPRPFSDTAAPSPAAPPPAALEERNVAPLRREDEKRAAAGGISASRAKTESFAPQGKLAASSVDRLAPWPDTPEKKLERIEELRKAGRDADADEAIARFRREHPDYRIPEDVWNRIKPR